MNVNVKKDRVLIKRVVNEAKTAGGILFTHTGEEKTNEGIVVSIGPGRETDEGIVIPVDLKIGDKVIYDIKSGIDIKLDGQALIMLKEENIYAVIEE